MPGVPGAPGAKLYDEAIECTARIAWRFFRAAAFAWITFWVAALSMCRIVIGSRDSACALSPASTAAKHFLNQVRMLDEVDLLRSA